MQRTLLVIAEPHPDGVHMQASMFQVNDVERLQRVALSHPTASGVGPTPAAAYDACVDALPASLDHKRKRTAFLFTIEETQGAYRAYAREVPTGFVPEGLQKWRKTDPLA